jgi:hypothetical protein
MAPGASDKKSDFLVNPGNHRLCTSLQSRLKSLTKHSAALSFPAEAGKVFYFRTKTRFILCRRTYSCALSIQPQLT